MNTFTNTETHCGNAAAASKQAERDVDLLLCIGSRKAAFTRYNAYLMRTQVLSPVMDVSVFSCSCITAIMIYKQVISFIFGKCPLSTRSLKCQEVVESERRNSLDPDNNTAQEKLLKNLRIENRSETRASG